MCGGIVRVLSLAVVSLLALSRCVLSQTVLAIDETVEYQTIEGFGATGGMDVSWGSGPLYDEQFLDDIVDDLGLTMVRNGTPESGTWDSRITDYARALKARADASGEPVYFIATCWSPPARFKDNNSTINGGHVIPSMYGELARFFVDIANQWHTMSGVELYALSFCNEPRFSQSYSSCLWTEEEFRDFLKIIGATFADEGLSTRIFGSEDMLGRFSSYVGYVNQDPEAKQYLHAFAVHGYVDGVNPASGITSWSVLAKARNALGCRAWQTEISGYTNEWSSTFGYVQNFANALRYGNISAWTWWQLSENADNEYSLMPYLGGKGKKYYASRHFYRFIRPGAVRVDLDDSADEDIIAQAYHHRDQQTLTVIIINTSGTPKEVVLAAGSLPSQFTRYTTSAAKNCANEGTVASNAAVVIEPESIVTLYGASYVTSTSPGTARVPAFVREGAGGHDSFYSLRGRFLDNGAAARGPCISVSSEGRGVARVMVGPSGVR